MRARRHIALAAMVAFLMAGCGHRSAPTEADLFNAEAALPSGLPVPALGWKVMSSSIDRQHGTMSTLTGNDIAVASARAGMPGTYPPGSVLALTTWAQRDDPHWFGGKIPGPFLSLETVTVSGGAAAYARYDGNPAVLMENGNPAQAAARKSYILAQRAAVLP
jgi:hypothetical protein